MQKVKNNKGKEERYNDKTNTNIGYTHTFGNKKKRNKKKAYIKPQ